RELHTLKGGARMAELPEVADLCHELETLYERLNDGVIDLSEDTLPLAQSAHDLLFTQLQSVREGKGPENPERMIEALKVASQRSGAESRPVQDTAEADSRAYMVQSETADESDREIVGIFLEEAGELMEALDEGVEAWRAEPSSTQGADELLRVLHTLKGGARLAGLSVIGDTAHNFESDIQKALSRKARFDDTFFMHLNERQENLQSKIDDVASLLDSDGVLVLGEKELVVDAPVSAQDVVADTGGQADAPVSLSDDLSDESQADTEGDEGSLAVVPLSGKEVEMAPERPAPAMAQQRKAPTELVKVSADLLDSLVNLAGETAIGRGRLEEQVSDFAGTLSEMDQTLDRMRDQLRRLDIETEAQVLFRQERHGPDYEDFDPLEMDRYSAMQQLSRALMESASDLIDLKETLSGKTRDAETLLLQQSRVNTELQEGLMKTRMVPFQRMVPRLRRIVRQVSLELNKQVELRVNNADGEMDRTILERMISPLEHMVRNAVDHGIESGEQRRAAGKPEKGSIELDIRRDGGDVVLTLRDDGQGINLDAVLKKARERGMVPDGVEPTEHDIMQFILQPGFSTAEVITQISGRGVGMDVVSSEIKQMGGSVEIRSEAGTGSEFEVRLPFTVSVNRALMVRIGEDLYAVPLNNIQGIVRASVAELQNLYDLPEGERFFNYAGRDYQLGYLGAMLDEHSHPKISGQHMPLPLLLVRGQVPFALQADALLGSREIVVKSLGPQFAGVRGISGGTILGDGSVVIILDLPAMIRTYTSLEYQQAKALDNKAAEARHEQERRLPKVLVVDDSVTVRKVTTRLLERHGMEVMTAKDGMHAMEVLQDVKPDVMLLDIEMPRMDGFEVASLVRHDERLKDLPIIMITSRTGDKHRERARSIGVNEYMGKPFQEEALLENINAFLGHEVY
ncbi:MAG TPA: hybrid sensor histidine kinase/response regulator, partial [Oceanospirillales bacterium]|nr:hybrid sensor histidine kinase/response regulator [Oceanospirillales bacterium]